ncbi:20524_t:CDS:2, partial [Racocetra persica]
KLLSKTDSDINNNSFEDKVDFIDQIDYMNEIDYEDMSETEASTSTLTKKPSIVQKNLPKRKKVDHKLEAEFGNILIDLHLYQIKLHMEN